MNKPGESINLRDTIIPKSDQLTADDLIGITRTITVTGVKRGETADQPVSIHYDGDNGRPYKPCKSMRRVMIHAWGDDGRGWIGKRMTLYCDPDVKFGGVKVGGIRISHLSDIDQTMNISLTATRGKRSPYTVEPLVTPQYPSAEFERNFPKWKQSIADAKVTPADVIAKIQTRGTLTPDQQSRIMALAPPSAQPEQDNQPEQGNQTSNDNHEEEF